MTQEEHFKRATAYPASEISAYVTGQTMMVHGGCGVW